VSRVAVVGLGAMGSRIAGRLLARGHDIAVWNRDPARAEPLVGLGARRVSSPAEAAAAEELVITMVTGPAALAAVTEGPEGVMAGAGGRTTIVQMSTVGIAAVKRLAAALPAHAQLLDAPVLGSLTEVENGTLKIFAGGEDSLVERWTPLLSDLGEVLHVGPVGAGSAAKLVANATLVGVIGVFGEALALAELTGLSQARAFEVLGTTALAGQVERRRQSIESGSYPPRFALSLARKDADLIGEAADGFELPVLAAAREWLVEAEQAGHGDEDYSSVLAELLRRAGQASSQPASTT
jgi:3-hydroxyisobutyrate dehydrogenase-like beta-hydroxyacid dehydrogenase